MIHTTSVEIQRLQRLHQATQSELQPLAQRRHPTAEETRVMTELKKKKLHLKDRITRLESIPPDSPDVA